MAFYHFLEIEDQCRRWLEKLRWVDGNIQCPVCGNTKLFKRGSDGWRCRGKTSGQCNDYSFTVITNTGFHKCKSVRQWLMVGELMLNKPSIPTKQYLMNDPDLKISGDQALKLKRIWMPIRLELSQSKSRGIGKLKLGAQSLLQNRLLSKNSSRRS